ncbi:sigma-24 (FecI-like protein) [Reticulibacter mediterranei]|uniref:Sigma-24 (FecI-like protein) n=1 Tax=Reticulibacter mediterranei TaxID=2778369 RepID=A0A8J3IR48_9CHLR|nr:sigma-70 family RNA polymerase sigma factor [Reticulibacter mediterranei]GHO95370.1 sigma-24 (FecI-like protein) [Reticulibacter mediterranei]
MQIQKQGNNTFVPVASDALLARVTLAGDQKAFATLVQRYDTTIFNFAYRFLGDEQQAGDILQEVCLRFYHALPTSTTETTFHLWLLRMTYTCCIDELRSKPGRIYRLSQCYGAYGIEETGRVGDFVGPVPAALSARSDFQQVMQQAMMALLPKQRAVIILRSILRLSFEEVGRIVEIPASTAQACFVQAKMLVRQYLRECPELMITGLEKM